MARFRSQLTSTMNQSIPSLCGLSITDWLCITLISETGLSLVPYSFHFYVNNFYIIISI